MGVGEKCREAQLATCEQESRCTGGSAECPKSAPMADATPCVEKGQCKHGRCIPYCETVSHLKLILDYPCPLSSENYFFKEIRGT
jgi:disintegrin and metalloproteinase domain-containing protein 17